MEGKSTESKRKAIGIIGSGQFATAFALRLVRAGYGVTIGSRRPEKARIISSDGAESVFGDIRMTSVTDCVTSNEIIVVAIHTDHYKSTFQPEVASGCQGKVLIDVSNRTTSNGRPQSSNAQLLRSMVPDATIVKAFNTVSAYVMESDAAGGSRRVPVASDNARARAVVVEMARDMGLEPYENGGLCNALAMEEAPLRLFPEWRIAARLASVVLFYWIIFALCRFYFATPGIMRWDQLPLKIFNKILGASTLTILSLTYLSGTCAAFLQIINGTKHKRFPGWMDAWLKARKQLGLIAFGMISIHACISTLILSSTYMSPWFAQNSVVFTVPANHTQDVVLNVDGAWMTWIGELSLLFGILAMALMAVLAITSLPSVTGTMSWAEWRLVQSQISYVMLTLAVTHVYFMGFPRWLQTDFPVVLFRVRLTSIVLPTLVIVLRLVLLLPCVANHVDRIRQGWERSPVTVEPVKNDAVGV